MTNNNQKKENNNNNCNRNDFGFFCAVMCWIDELTVDVVSITHDIHSSWRTNNIQQHMLSDEQQYAVYNSINANNHIK